MANPYEATSLTSEVGTGSARRSVSPVLLVVWPILLALNLVMPLVVGMPMIESSGKLGVAIAVAAFAITGWIICVYRPQLSKRLLAGSTVVGLSQIFPVLHLIAGKTAFSIVAHVGQAEVGGDLGLDRIKTEFGGFLVALLTGGVLTVCAVAIGYGMFAIFNTRSNASLAKGCIG
ncbi:MAG: hypothetical protein ACO1RT_07445 [Planctomycetaceae bacterium]